MCSFRSTEHFSRKGKWCLWDQGGAVEDDNDGKSERDGGPSRHPWSRGGVACVPFPSLLFASWAVITRWFQSEPVYTCISLFAMVTWESCFSTSILCGPLDPGCQRRGR